MIGCCRNEEGENKEGDTIGQGHEPTNAHIGPCYELAALPGVDPAFDPCVEQKQGMRRQRIGVRKRLQGAPTAGEQVELRGSFPSRRTSSSGAGCEQTL